MTFRSWWISEVKVVDPVSLLCRSKSTSRLLGHESPWSKRPLAARSKFMFQLSNMITCKTAMLFGLLGGPWLYSHNLNLDVCVYALGSWAMQEFAGGAGVLMSPAPTKMLIKIRGNVPGEHSVSALVPWWSMRINHIVADLRPFHV